MDDASLTIAEDLGMTESLSVKILGGESREKLELATSNQVLIVDSVGFHSIVGNQEEWFKTEIFWLASEDSMQIPEGLRLNSNFYGVQISASGYGIREIYRVKGTTYEQEIGKVGESDGKIDRVVPYIWERRKNLQGIVLTAASVHWPLISNLAKDGNFTDFLPECLSGLQHRSNFSIAWTVPEDGSYGAPLGNNGSWSGLIGMLQQGKVDISVGLAVTFDRSRVVDFLTAITQARSTLVIVNPKYVGKSAVIDSMSFMSAFTPSVWVGMAVILGALIAVYQLFFAVCYDPLNHTSFLSGFPSSLAFVYNASLRFGLTRQFARFPLASRIFFLVSVSYPIVITAHFEAVLTSFMTVVTPTAVMTSAGEAAEFGYRVVTLAGSKLVTELEGAPQGSGWYKTYHGTMKGREDAFLSSLKSLAEAALDDPRHVAIFGSQYFFVNEPRLLPLTGLIDAKVDQWAFALQQDSEFFDLFNYNMIKLHSAGLIEFLKHKWIDRREPSDICSHNKQEAWAMGYTNLAFPTGILLSGLLLGLALGIAEKLLKKDAREKGRLQQK